MPRRGTLLFLINGRHLFGYIIGLCVCIVCVVSDSVMVAGRVIFLSDSVIFWCSCH